MGASQPNDESKIGVTSMRNKSQADSPKIALAIVIVITLLVIASGSMRAGGQASPEAAGSPAPGASPVGSPTASPAVATVPPGHVVITAGKVDLTITDSEITPRHFEVAAGQSLDLTITNSGRLVHTFAVPELKASAHLEPGTSEIVHIEKPRLGEYDYAVDGAKGEDSAMTGTFTIYI